MIVRAAKNPKRLAIIAIAGAVIVYLGLFLYTDHKIRSVAQPIFQALSGLSDDQQQSSHFSFSGYEWNGAYHLREERSNEKAQQAIKKTLIAEGWTIEREESLILGSGNLGAFYVIANGSDHTLVARLQKPGDKLVVAIAKTGKTEVSPEPPSLKLSAK